MAVSPQQYNKINKVYNDRRTENAFRLEKRKEEIFSKLPEYKFVNDEIISTCMRYARDLIAAGKGAQAKAVMAAGKNGHMTEDMEFSDASTSSATEFSGDSRIGNQDILSAMRSEIFDLHQKKNRILTNAGYPADYLEMTYTCPLCRDTGFIDDEKCVCYKKLEVEFLYENSHINEFLQQNNFNNLSMEYYDESDIESFQHALEVCHSFIHNFYSDYHNLLFYGTTGTSKSFLSGCVAKELLDRGATVIYYSAVQLFQLLSVYTFEEKEHLLDFMESLKSCDLLIIDDLGSELINDFTKTQFFSILNDRILCRKSIIISTNLKLEELRTKYSDRIFSRTAENFELIRREGKDIRLLRMQET
ncbi:MAG: ATP-binding protein [Lachnospiraceae bacterium]